MLRRCVLTVAAAVPGFAQALRRRWLISSLLAFPALGGVVLVGWWVGRAGALGTALDPVLLRRAAVVGVLLGALAAVSMFDAARDLWSSRRVRVVAVLPLLVSGAGAWIAFDHAAAIDTVFTGDAVAAEPSAQAAADGDAPPSTEPRPTTHVPAAETSAAPTTTAPPRPTRWNLLLVGGDGESGRSGVRTDALVVVSVGQATGDVALVSIPRNLRNLPLPVGSPLRGRYPDGWPDLANSLYDHVLSTPADGDGTPQAAERALAGAVAEALGIRIDNYVKVDMVGFIRLIDVLGGVDLTIARAVPGPGPIFGAAREAQDYYGPGRVHLDGTDALYYSRSRAADSDYARMGRQRCLLAAAARQVSPARLLTKYRDLVAVMEQTVRSDLSPAQARDLVDLFDSIDTDAIRSLGLVPPLVDTTNPDYPALRRLVRQAIDTPIPGPTTAPGPTSAPGPTTTAVAVLTEASSC